MISNILLGKIMHKATTYNGTPLASTDKLTNGILSSIDDQPLGRNESDTWYHIFDKEYAVSQYKLSTGSGASYYAIRLHNSKGEIISRIDPVANGLVDFEQVNGVKGVSIVNTRNLDNLIREIELYGEEYIKPPLNKTLILHEGEYKKFDREITHEQDKSKLINLIPIMTDYTTPSGIASASGEYSSNLAWKAFDDTSTVTSWVVSGISDVWLQYEFVEAVSIESYSLTPHTNPAQTPMDFKILGSNNGSDFEEIDTKIGEVFTTQDEKTFTLGQSSKYYKIIRIYSTANNGHSSLTSLSSFKLNGYKTTTKVSSPKPITVSKILPTSTQFIDEGMDSLTPLLDRVVQNLNPQEMTLDSTFVGEGKLFRKSVDLNKYFDLRTITTETRNS